MMTSSSAVLSDAKKELFELCGAQLKIHELISQWLTKYPHPNMETMVDDLGRTPLMVAVQNSNKLVVEWLIAYLKSVLDKKGPAVLLDYLCKTDLNGKTVFDYAIDFEEVRYDTKNDIKREIIGSLLSACPLPQEVLDKIILKALDSQCLTVLVRLLGNVVYDYSYRNSSQVAFKESNRIIRLAVQLNVKNLEKILKWELDQTWSYGIMSVTARSHQDKNEPLLAGLALLNGNVEIVNSFFLTNNLFHKKEGRDRDKRSFITYVLLALQQNKINEQQAAHYIDLIATKLNPENFLQECHLQELTLALPFPKIFHLLFDKLLVKVDGLAKFENSFLRSHDVVLMYYAVNDSNIKNRLLQLLEKLPITAQAIAITIRQNDIEMMVKLCKQASSCSKDIIDQPVKEADLQDPRVKLEFRKDVKTSFTCIRYAARLGNPDLVAKLLEFKPELNIRRDLRLFAKFCPALNDAAALGNLSVVEVLLEKKADPALDSRTHGYSVLDYYEYRDVSQIVRIDNQFLPRQYKTYDRLTGRGLINQKDVKPQDEPLPYLQPIQPFPAQWDPKLGIHVT